ncbi:MAG: cation:proton antiporter subunit C [Firmicutes bacterium]|nr:cation:proton antiporter subunit C [Bacillota bacterium]
MEQLTAFLAEQGIFMLTIMLFFLGVFGIASCGNYMKKLICVNIMQVAVIFFFLCLGQKTNGTIPVAVEHLISSTDYVNPLPHALMLTAIVVSLGTTGVGLALLMRIKDKYGTMEEEEIIKKEDEK